MLRGNNFIGSQEAPPTDSRPLRKDLAARCTAPRPYMAFCTATPSSSKSQLRQKGSAKHLTRSRHRGHGSIITAMLPPPPT